MSLFDSSRDREPLGYVRGVAVHATTVLVAFHVVALVVVAIVTSVAGWPGRMIYSRDSVLAGEVWRIATYVVLNEPTIFFLIEMYFLWIFGRDVEQHIGRRAFVRLYFLLLLVPPVLLLAVPGASLSGAGSAHFAVFVAFATLFPEAMFWGRIPARTVVLVLLGIYVLADIMWHDWSSLVALLAASGTAFAVIGYEQGRWTFRLPQRAPRLKVLKPEPVPVNVDAILDKVAKSGLDSLTRDERTALERARSQLLGK